VRFIYSNPPGASARGGFLNGISECFFARKLGVCNVGVSDPEIQKKVFGPRWQHEVAKQGWPLWKRLVHRLQRCPICKPKTADRKNQ